MNGLSSVRWLWRQAGFPAGLGGGNGLAIATSGSLLGMFASTPAGDAVDALITGGGQPDREMDLPLLSVSGAASAEEGFVVVGAAQDGTSAAVCTLDTERRAVKTARLPSDGGISVWPVVTGTGPPTVVWVAGSAPSILRYGVLPHGEFRDLGSISLEGAVWSIETTAAADPVDADAQMTDVLFHTPEGARYVRLSTGADHTPPVGPAGTFFPRGARLSVGMVASASGVKELAIWQLPHMTQHQVKLPPPPPDGTNRVASPLLTPDPALLIWTTLAPDSRSVDDGSATAQVVVSRGWMASLDQDAWQIGPAIELPIAPVVADTMGSDLVIANGSAVWIGQPDASSQA